jgi:hypothetical protein
MRINNPDMDSTITVLWTLRNWSEQILPMDGNFQYNLVPEPNPCLNILFKRRTSLGYFSLSNDKICPYLHTTKVQILQIWDGYLGSGIFHPGFCLWIFPVPDQDRQH